MGWLSRLLGSKDASVAEEKPDPPARPALSRDERLRIAADVLAAERAGGSHWVEGVAIAEAHGVSIFDIHDEYMAVADRADRAARTVTRETVRVDPANVVDLSSVDSVRMRVKGTYNYVDDSERHTVGGSEYLLVREPSNEHDPLAVAVLALDGRKVGYVSASRAAMIAPLLDATAAGAYRVSGAAASEFSVKLWVDVPKLPALRAFFASP